jgi:hypothetical protein
VRTTVNIDDHLLTEAKALAASTGRKLGEVVSDALSMMLARQSAPISGQRVVLPTDGGSGLRPGVDLDDKEALAEALGDNYLFDRPHASG